MCLCADVEWKAVCPSLGVTNVVVRLCADVDLKAVCPSLGVTNVVVRLCADVRRGHQMFSRKGLVCHS